jgi:hypothetical protein
MNAEKQPAVAGPVEPKVRLVSTWFGRPIDELTREELLEVVEWCVIVPNVGAERRVRLLGGLNDDR